MPRRAIANLKNSSGDGTGVGLVYQILADDNLSGANLAVEETAAADTSHLPPLGDHDGDGSADYEYRNFRISQPLSEQPRGFPFPSRLFQNDS